MSDQVLTRLHTGVKDALAAGADEAEVSHANRTMGFTRFANSYFTQAGIFVEPVTRVRVLTAGRVGAATTAGTDREALAHAARTALEIARHQPKSNFPGFSRDRIPPSNPPDSPGFSTQPRTPPELRSAHDEKTAACSPAERAEPLAAAFARAARDKLVCAGSFFTGPRESAVVTSGGVALYDRATEVSVVLIALDGDASGYTAWHGPSIAGLSRDGGVAALADDACDKATRARDPIELPPGPIDVILSPNAVAELLEWMAIASFGGQSVLDGTSFLAGEEGEPLCDQAVTVVDDAAFTHPHAIPVPFDPEGVRKRRVVLIDHGRRGEPLTDLQTGARLGVPSTGHAGPISTFFTEGPLPANLVMLPGDATQADLLSRTERGVYVNRFHYVNGLLDTRRATMTGMTRDAAFLIEHGRLGRAVKHLRFTESMLEAWSRLGGVGRDLHGVAAHWTGHGSYLCPSILVRGFHFTGRSR